MKPAAGNLEGIRTASRPANPIAIADLMHREASSRQIVRAAVFGGAVVLLTLAAAQFARVSGPVIVAFVPICATLWGIADLLTAFLLFTQFSVNGIRAYLALGAAYMLPGLLTIAYLAYFPGVFFTSGLSFGAQQISAWLWIGWHAAFPIVVGAYHLADRGLRARIASGPAVRRSLQAVVGATGVSCAAVVALVIGMQAHLPIIVSTGAFTTLYAAIVVPLFIVSNVGATIAILAFSKRPSALQVWLIVAMLTSTLDGVLNALSTGRYTVSWDVGKIETLVTATVVLMVLLAEVSSLYGRLSKLATVDALTALPNRHAFDSDAHWALEMHKRTSVEMAFLVVDIDHFKKYNDTYGHQAGDECLRQVAASMRKSCERTADLVGRYGGEEFVVLLPGTTAVGAALVAEAIRSGVEALGILHSASPVAPVVTVSVGGTHAAGGRDLRLEVLFRSADAALYRAKAKRNAIVLDDDLTASNGMLKAVAAAQQDSA